MDNQIQLSVLLLNHEKLNIDFTLCDNKQLIDMFSDDKETVLSDVKQILYKVF